MLKSQSSTGIVTGLLLLCSLPLLMAAEKAPQVGEKADDFELKSVTGEAVRLSETVSKGPVVLIVLRGFPGYQCPICNQQVGQYLAQAEKLKAAGANVLLVYPGPSRDLVKLAQEFMNDTTIPAHFQLLVDPDYTFTNAYHLRWNATGETAYPATFVIDKNQKVIFAKVSQKHGGRSTPEEVLKALAGP